MEGCDEVQFTQHAVTVFLTMENILPIDIQSCMQAVYGDKCVDVSTVSYWVWQFKQEEEGKQACVTKQVPGVCVCVCVQ
jgi:hypothetical protein